MTCRFWISIAVVPVLLTGCISPGRMADLGDCGTFGIGVGQGLDATLRLGALSEASLGIGHRINYFGWDDRGDIDYYEPFQWSWPFSTVSYGIFSALLGRPCGLTPNDSFCFEPNAAWRSRHNPNEIHYEGEYYGKFLPFLSEQGRKRTFNFHNCTRTEAEIVLGPVGVRAGINPLEILDFILGFFGLDIAGDDPNPPNAGNSATTEEAP